MLCRHNTETNIRWVASSPQKVQRFLNKKRGLLERILLQRGLITHINLLSLSHCLFMPMCYTIVYILYGTLHELPLHSHFVNIYLFYPSFNFKHLFVLMCKATFYNNSYTQCCAVENEIYFTRRFYT